MEKSTTPRFTEEQLEKIGGSIKTGKFFEALTNSHDNIKESQAAAMAGDLEFAAKNEINQFVAGLRNVKRKKEEMISQYVPTTSFELKIPGTLDASKFIKEYNALGLEERNLSIQLSTAIETYEELIGQKFS